LYQQRWVPREFEGPAGDQRWFLMQLKFYSLFFIAPEFFTGLIWNVKHSGVFVIACFVSSAETSAR
jgi:hypothetical protein